MAPGSIERLISRVRSLSLFWRVTFLTWAVAVFVLARRSSTSTVKQSQPFSNHALQFNVHNNQDQPFVSSSNASSPWEYWKQTMDGDVIFNDPCGFVEKCRISLGLYGKDPKYLKGALRNVELQPQVFPGWKVRIYHDDSVPEDALNQLLEAGAELVKVDFISGGIAGMFWRFLVAADPSVDRYVIRDADSRLSPREKAAVNEWIASGKKAHVIRDHPSHAKYSMSGGMWGGTKCLLDNIEDAIVNFRDKGRYIADMNFLDRKIWPIVRDDMLQHSSYGCTAFGPARPFPTRRSPNMEHVGQRFSENDDPDEMDMRILLKSHAPEDCRKHPEWLWG